MTTLGQTQTKSFPLRLAEEGEMVRIVSFSGGRNFNGRVAGMGLSLSVELEVLQNRGDGKMIVDCRGTRLFIGGGMAHKIQVSIVRGGVK